MRNVTFTKWPFGRGAPSNTLSRIDSHLFRVVPPLAPAPPPLCTSVSMWPSSRRFWPSPSCMCQSRGSGGGGVSQWRAQGPESAARREAESWRTLCSATLTWSHRTAILAQAGCDAVSRRSRRFCSASGVSAATCHGPEQEVGARRRFVGGSVEAHFAGSSSSLTQVARCTGSGAQYVSRPSPPVSSTPVRQAASDGCYGATPTKPHPRGSGRGCRRRSCSFGECSGSSWRRESVGSSGEVVDSYSFAFS